MSRVIVLMYHAIYANDSERDAIAIDDRPYAVSLNTFKEHLATIAQAGLPVVTPQQPGSAPLSIMLTFDDGHASNYHYAFPLLKEKNWPGIFFVTSDFVTSRADFCTLTQLREMADNSMIIGAHGQTHRFFDDLSDTELNAELHTSRRTLADGVGLDIDTLSFPGGRFRESQLALLQTAGFRWNFSSAIGICDRRDFQRTNTLPRIAIRGSTDQATFNAIIQAAPSFYWRQRAIAGVKKSLRRVIGNRLYHALYHRLAG